MDYNGIDKKQLEQECTSSSSDDSDSDEDGEFFSNDFLIWYNKHNENCRLYQ